MGSYQGDGQAHRQSVEASASAPPIDLDHLARQTFGDTGLRAEILDLFLAQLDGDGRRLAAAEPDERRRIAHALVGSARGVGAFALAECAAAIERDPVAEEPVRRFARLADAVRAFVGSDRASAGAARS